VSKTGNTLKCKHCSKNYTVFDGDSVLCPTASCVMKELLVRVKANGGDYQAISSLFPDNTNPNGADDESMCSSCTCTLTLHMRTDPAHALSPCTCTYIGLVPACTSSVQASKDADRMCSPYTCTLTLNMRAHPTHTRSP
jgi:hypothetical protein